MIAHLRGPFSFAVRTTSGRFLVAIGFVVALTQSYTSGWSSSGWNDAIQTAIKHGAFIAFAVGASAALDASRYRRRLPVTIQLLPVLLV